MITYARLREVLHYDPRTGLFTNLMQRGTALPGQIAGNVKTNGYIQMAIDKKMYLAHRLAWLYMTGEWPLNLVDHINRQKSDNRWSNLREATASQNHFNRVAMANNKSGFKGVSWNNKRQKWYAFIFDGEHQHFLGAFDDAAEAHKAYAAAAPKFHGEFARVA